MGKVYAFAGHAVVVGGQQDLGNWVYADGESWNSIGGTAIASTTVVNTGRINSGLTGIDGRAYADATAGELDVGRDGENEGPT